MTTTGKGPHWISSVLDLQDIPTPDLVDAKHELEASVQDIEGQLGASKEFELEAAKEKTLLPNEHRWRRSAKIALRMKLNDITRVKAELTKRENPDYNRVREHRRAIDILADLVDVWNIGRPHSGYDPTIESLITEANRLIAVRDGTP